MSKEGNRHQGHIYISKLANIERWPLMPVLALSVVLARAWVNHSFLKYPLSPVLALAWRIKLKGYVKHFCIL